MQLPPAEVILSWPTPNYVDPKDVRGPQLTIITFVLFPIALVMVALRMFTRVFITKGLGADDWFLVAAVIPTAVCASLTLLAIQRWGWNRHIWDVPPDLVILGLKLTIPVECAFALAVSLTKMSMLLLTRRVLTNGAGIMRRVVAVMMFIVTTEAIIFCFVVIFTCSPPSAYWTLSEAPQNCINEKIHLLISGSINTFTDFGVVLLPLPTVLSLKMNRTQQIVLVGLFGAGFAICLAGIFRIYFQFKSMETFDRTWMSYGSWISGVIELYVGVICTAIPSCKPFFSRYLPTVFGSLGSLGSSRGTYNPGQKSRSVPMSGPCLHPPQNSFIAQERSFSQASELIRPYELQSIPKSEVDTNNMRNSRHLLPLSYLDPLRVAEVAEVPEVPERSSVKRSSNGTSISSFIEGNLSSTSTIHVAQPSALEGGVHPSDSLEELVKAGRR